MKFVKFIHKKKLIQRLFTFIRIQLIYSSKIRFIIISHPLSINNTLQLSRFLSFLSIQKQISLISFAAPRDALSLYVATSSRGLGIRNGQLHGKLSPSPSRVIPTVSRVMTSASGTRY